MLIEKMKRDNEAGTDSGQMDESILIGIGEGLFRYDVHTQEVSVL